MKINGYTILVLLTLVGCTPKLYTRFCSAADVEGWNAVADRSVTSLRKDPCSDYLAYIPDTNHLDHTPIKYIRVNIHWMNTSDHQGNYDGQKAIDFTKGLMHAANYDLAKNAKMWLPYRNQTPVIPIRYRVVLTPRPNDPNDEGIYFHYDDSLCYYIHKGKNANLYDKRVIQKYGVQLDTVLNIFMMPHHPDSVISATYLAGGVGVALGNAIKMAGPFDNPKNTYWDYRGVFNHEIGHIYGLSHTWAYNDGCDDTPLHSQDCFGPGDRPGCDTLASNNIMDYSALQNAWSPCQIGRILYRMSILDSRHRRFLQPNWCTLHEDRNIVIQDTVEWHSHKDLEGHLTIAPGGKLTIGCRVALPADAKITVQPGGELVLDHCRLFNDCGETWEGIEIQQQGERKGRVVALGQPVIENAKHLLEE